MSGTSYQIELQHLLVNKELERLNLSLLLTLALAMQVSNLLTPRTGLSFRENGCGRGKFEGSKEVRAKRLGISTLVS